MCNYIHIFKLLKQVFQICILKFCLLALSAYKRNMLKYSTKTVDLSISPYVVATAIFVCVLGYKTNIYLMAYY